jgi:molybdopterin synthase catalytic subunit
MTRDVAITVEPLLPMPLPRDVSSGAVIDFWGVVRELEAGRTMRSLRYECYKTMALEEMARILDSLECLHQVRHVTLHHRMGDIAPGQPSLFIRVTAAHRDEAFAFSQALIVRLKESAPIWKTPVYPAA